MDKSYIPLALANVGENVDNDGRIAIRCKGCGETLTMFRYFPADVHLAKNLNAIALTDWLQAHANHPYSNEDATSSGDFPDFEFVITHSGGARI